MGQQCIHQRRHPQVERTPRRAQRLVRLQHDGELGKIEASDIDQSSCPLFRRDFDRMRECIADLAQGHQCERWRQVEFPRKRRTRPASGFEGQESSVLPFSFD